MTNTKTHSGSMGTGVQLAIGAASLFLFIVGLKRTFRVEDANGNLASVDASADHAENSDPEPSRMS